MFDVKDLLESPFGVMLLNPPSEEDYYGEDEDPAIYEKPVHVRLNVEMVDCVGYILNKYRDKYVSKFGRKLYSSDILRTANKLGLVYASKKGHEVHKFFKIYDDIYWFREILLYNLYEKTQNEQIFDLIDELRTEIDKSLVILESRDLWGKKMIRKTFIPYPRWRDVTGRWASKIHVTTELMYRISATIGLNTERPLKTYKVLISEFYNIIARSFSLMRYLAKTAEDIFIKHREYFLDRISNKPSLSEEIRNIILSAIGEKVDGGD